VGEKNLAVGEKNLAVADVFKKVIVILSLLRWPHGG